MAIVVGSTPPSIPLEMYKHLSVLPVIGFWFRKSSAQPAALVADKATPTLDKTCTKIVICTRTWPLLPHATLPSPMPPAIDTRPTPKLIRGHHLPLPLTDLNRSLMILADIRRPTCIREVAESKSPAIRCMACCSRGPKSAAICGRTNQSTDRGAASAAPSGIGQAAPYSIVPHGGDQKLG